MRLLPRTLAGRIVFTTVAVALVSAVVAGAVSLGLVRAASLGDARSEASTLADQLAALPQNQLEQRVNAQTSGSGEPKVALINTNGTVTGSIGVVLRPKVRQRLEQGSTLSTTVELGGRRFIVEARQAIDGGTVVVARSLNSVDAAVSRVAGQLLIALAVGLAVAIGSGILLARVVSRPLSRTAAAARRLAKGDRNVELPHTATVEVSDVVNALDELDDALTVSEARQREFLLSISHDLRTPLTALRGYAEALADGVVGAEDARDVGSTMLTETRRLDRFVADLLELARLEAHDFAAELTPVDIAGVMAEAAAAWRAVASSGGVELRTDVHPGVIANTDAHRLRQIVDGLLENALRATPSGGVVAVEASTLSRADGGSRVAVTVSDSGAGLTAEDRDTAFVRGALHDKYRQTRAVGTGLGLSIAQRLTARLGGTLTAVDTTGTPWGASFRLELPGADGQEPVRAGDAA
ncbi:sensor histidine kinase [Humibacter sp.]|uniref:sensor histidine kinase n=1 Tax=Humibacter sp. TaxID=1940291 RepID=UPI003F7EB85A